MLVIRSEAQNKLFFIRAGCALNIQTQRVVSKNIVKNFGLVCIMSSM